MTTKEKILKFEEIFGDYLNYDWDNRTPLEKKRYISEFSDQIRQSTLSEVLKMLPEERLKKHLIDENPNAVSGGIVLYGIITLVFGMIYLLIE